ncbi:MAG: hypothetical protein CMJ24_08820 [Phycisphaerae bacterium]|nr:hypothetical protein [Phycisphaerae bacterium]|tara:strand:- start:5181 stop:5585 length:405 start_codon:yes stop_codon:yes gene_type:complete
MRTIMNIRLLSVVTLAILLGGCSSTLDHQLQSNDRLYDVSWSSAPTPIPVNEFFTLDIEVRHDGKLMTDGNLAVDAAMPHHNHGMNHVPDIQRTGPGRWHVRDMLFHMPGYWELYFDIEQEGVVHRSQESIEVD